MKKVHDDDNNDDNDYDDTNPGWIIVRVGMYSVADKNVKEKNGLFPLISAEWRMERERESKGEEEEEELFNIDGD